ncbi:T-cell ecto-ADP-ribosyltransferase 2-like [Thunnus thynnus]|uniref:T-cell ecto-ADP-ribosyltransferase 2-like n=1 Tax=Thunnus thynnus TaxID=8237 RepID=UPI0035294C4D
MAVPCTIIMAATVLTALMPPIYCLEETREPSRDPRRHGENMQTPRRDLPIVEETREPSRDPRRHRENMETPRRDLPIVNSGSFPLNIGCDAVDDMYDGCTEEMKDKVEKKYFKKENKKIFKYVWTKCSEKKYSDNEALAKNHMLAICAYTSNSGKKANDKKLYDEFNKAVRTSRNFYGSSSKFKFHYLHYWLTTAIQILNRNQGCQTTYRKTKDEFTGKVKQIMRFGAFASSSKRTNIKTFGSKTCFKIETCSGAYLNPYSEHPSEEEVLIPPYETFNITDITEGRSNPQGLNDCEKVFVLKSVGEVSNLNCKLAAK